MNTLIQKKSVFLLIFTLVMAYGNAHAQATDITGKVTESKTGEILSGVTVVEVNPNDRQVNGTNTDKDGNYSIRLSNPTNKLRFSYIGFLTKTESINGRSTINVQLVTDSSRSNTQDVVVVSRRPTEQVSNGFGTTAQRDIIGAISTIKADAIADQPITSIDQMIQGKAAGVQVISNSGDPGAGIEIRIRGAGSISGGNAPLFIVDGIPIISTPGDAGNSVARINPIADINPNDIEKMDILKDANAAAIYGARAANGVVIITTKRGKAGRTTIDFSTQFSLQNPPPSIPVLSGSEYKVMRLEGLQSQGNINPASDAARPFVDDPTYVSYPYYQFNTKWLDHLKQTGKTQFYNLSVSGGGEAMRYSFSTSFRDQVGAWINTRQQTFTSRFNLDYTVSQKLKFNAQISLTRSKRNAHASYTGGSIYLLGHIKNPSLPVYDIDLKGNQLPSYFALAGNQFPLDNPVAFANTVINDAYSTNLQPSVRADYLITKNLRFTSSGSINFFGENGSTFYPPEATGSIWNDARFNAVETRDDERLRMTNDNWLSFDKSFSLKLKSKFLLGNTFTYDASNGLGVANWATGSRLLNTLGSAGGYARLSTNKAEESLLSVFVQTEHVYNDKYGFNATLRRDGSSKFGGNNKYGYFPAVGGYWRISSESMMKSFHFINDLKLRASWGTVGNKGGLGNYAYISRFNPGANYNGQNGVTQGNPELLDLRWESYETTNLGLDFSLFKNRLSGQLEGYNKITRDLLFGLAVPASSGLSGGITTNLGSIRNRGVELTLSYNAIKAARAGEFNWDIDFNIANNKNKVLSLPGGTLKSNGFARFSSQIKEGDPLGTFYGLVYKGVYATDDDAVVRDAGGKSVFTLDGSRPRKMRINNENGDTLRGGDAIYEDFNHDGIINDQDRVLVGNANADFFGGFTSTMSYKGFSLRVFINFVYGNDVINGTRYNLEKMDNNDNQAITTLKRWRKQGDITNMPRALNGSDRNYQGSTRWVEDGSYARLSQLTLNYLFPRTLVRKIKMNSIRMFLTANNLVTVSNYTGADPEFFSGGELGVGLAGVDQSQNPRSKGYTVGLNVGF